MMMMPTILYETVLPPGGWCLVYERQRNKYPHTTYKHNGVGLEGENNAPQRQLLPPSTLIVPICSPSCHPIGRTIVPHGDGT